MPIYHIVRCSACDTDFRTEFGFKKYCSFRCKKRGERQRARGRDGAPAEDVRREDVHITLHSPSVEQLMAAAYTYVLIPGTKPSVFTGAIPAFTVPHRVVFNQGLDKAWVMFAGETAGERQQIAVVDELVVPCSPLDILHGVTVAATSSLAERYTGIPTGVVATVGPQFTPRDGDGDDVTLPEDNTL